MLPISCLTSGMKNQRMSFKCMEQADYHCLTQTVKSHAWQVVRAGNRGKDEVARVGVLTVQSRWGTGFGFDTIVNSG